MMHWFTFKELLTRNKNVCDKALLLLLVACMMLSLVALCY